MEKGEKGVAMERKKKFYLNIFGLDGTEATMQRCLIYGSINRSSDKSLR